MQPSGRHLLAQLSVRPGASMEFGDHLGFVRPAFKFHAHFVAKSAVRLDNGTCKSANRDEGVPVCRDRDYAGHVHSALTSVAISHLGSDLDQR